MVKDERAQPEDHKDWRCPDPSCKYVGYPAPHITSLPPGHTWSAGQVVHALHTRRQPINGHHS